MTRAVMGFVFHLPYDGGNGFVGGSRLSIAQTQFRLNKEGRQISGFRVLIDDVHGADLTYWKSYQIGCLKTLHPLGTNKTRGSDVTAFMDGLLQNGGWR